MPRPDVAMLSRLVAMMMLWLTLTGSLGMLLQAVVRERANRALESLLAAAQGWEIVTGKMLGVGAVSLLVLASWLGSAAAFSLFCHRRREWCPPYLASLAQPLTLLRDGLIYICAFAFYGAITVALGAMARDSAAAQNLVRPMFVLLLAAFFVALDGGKIGGPILAGLVSAFHALPLAGEFCRKCGFRSHRPVLLGLLLLAAFAMQSLAARLISIAAFQPQIFVSTRTETTTLGIGIRGCLFLPQSAS